MNTRRFIVVGIQRSGTTVTGLCLAGHPNVTMPGAEISSSSPFFTHGLTAFTDGKGSYRDRKEGFPRLFDTLCSLHLKPDTRAIGIKTALGSHQEACHFTNCMREYFADARIILVHRDDLVAQYGSMIRAMRTGEWHAFEGRKGAGDLRVVIKPKAFEAYARDCIKIVGQLRALGETHQLLEFNYEKDICPGTAYSRLFDFLELPRVPITWLRMGKVAPAPEQYIRKYARLVGIQQRLDPSDPRDELAHAEALLAEQARREHPGFLMDRAVCRLESGSLEGACSDIVAGLENGKKEGGLDPSSRGVVFGMLESFDGEWDRDRIGAILKALREGCDGNPYFLYHRAVTRFHKAKKRSAREDLVAALTSDQDLDRQLQGQAFHLLEKMLQAFEDPEWALQVMDALLPRHGNNPDCLFLQGLVLLRLGHREEAIATFKRVQGLDPNHGRVARQLADCGAE